MDLDTDPRTVTAKEETAQGGEGACKATEAAEEAVGERGGRRMAVRSKERRVGRSSCFSPTSRVGVSMR